MCSVHEVDYFFALARFSFCLFYSLRKMDKQKTTE
jgi:hypothetical protein